MEHPTAVAVADVVRPLLAREGYDLILVEFVPRSRILRLFIDREDAGAEVGVTIDDCSRMSRLVGDVLDGEGLSDSIGERYTLEVSSPGLDRPLTRPKDFRRFAGEEIKLTTTAALEGRRRFRGRLAAADENEVRLEVDGREYAIGYDIIERARLVPQF